MRIRRPSQPVVPTPSKDRPPTKAGNLSARRDVIKTKSLPNEPGGKPQPKAGNTRGARAALRLKDLLVGAADGFQGNRGLGNTRARRPDGLKPQGIRGNTDGFVDAPGDKLHPKAGNTRGGRPTIRTKDLRLGPSEQIGEAGNARARRPSTIRREDDFDRPTPRPTVHPGGGNNLGNRGGIKIR